MRLWIPLLIITFALSLHAKAVETIINGTASFNATEPTDSDIPNWDTGWGESGITGWDFVGRVNAASGVYLGNGWVITVGHVGPGNLVLASGTYDYVPGSEQNVTAAGENPDITLFQIATSPDLPSLSIGPMPTELSDFRQGSMVAMIGFGGGGESWGYNTVTQVNDEVALTGYTFETTDFETNYGVTTSTNGAYSCTNNAVLYSGDSGGGDFIFSSGKWMLSGLNEAVDTGSNNSYMVQLSTYSTQINGIISAPAVPEPVGAIGIGLAGVIITAARRRRHPWHRVVLRCERRGTPLPQLALFSQYITARGSEPIRKEVNEARECQSHIGGGDQVIDQNPHASFQGLKAICRPWLEEICQPVNRE